MKIGLHTGLMILYFGLAASQKEFKALVFDRKKKSLIETPNDEIPKDTKLGEWALACPASDASAEDENGKFNRTKSFSKNALFVEKIYDKDDEKMLPLPVKICDKPFKLSIAMHEQRSSLFYYEFGYDIYFEHSDSEKFELSDKGVYRSISDTLNIPKILGRMILIPFNIFSSKTIMQDKEKGFTWIPLFGVKTFGGHFSKVKYEIHPNNRRPFMECQDYSLGEEMYKGIDIDTLYSKKVQEKAFKKFYLPKWQLTCELCFEKWLLIPADQFQFDSSVLPTCSNMATIPIWSSIVKKLLENLDKYLYAVSKVLGRRLRILAGVHKHLRFPLKYLLMKSAITLKNNGVTIYVPKIIYKLVRVKLNDNCSEKGIFCWYGVAIIIHNDPTFNAKQICHDETKNLGWEDITHELKKNLEHIYVCQITVNVIEYFRLKLDQNVSDIGKLSLKTRSGNKSLKSRILKELAKDESKFETNQIVERPLYNNFKDVRIGG